MKLNFDVLQSCGTALLWIGVALGIAGVALFIASGVHVGYSDITTSHVSNPDGSAGVKKSIACGVMYIGTFQRLAFILPLLAGILLAYSGYSIRHTVQNLRAEIKS